MDADGFLTLVFAIPCGLFEIYISAKKYAALKSPSKDRGTFYFIWLVVMLAQNCSFLCAGLGYGSKMINNGLFKNLFWIPLSILLYVMGMLLRKQAIEQLGKWFTTTIRTDKDHQIIDSGWYGKMRHPAYSGALLYFFALALLLNNWLSLIVSVVPIYVVFYYRIYVEEQELVKHFGAKYEDYRKRVPYLLVPRIF